MMSVVKEANMDLFLAVISVLIILVDQLSANQAPQWTNFPSNMLVSEDAMIGSVVAILNSSDPDDETLQFDLKGELANDILSVTSLNHTEAVVRLSKQLDREIFKAHMTSININNDRFHGIQEMIEAAEEYSLLFVVTDGENVVQRWCTLFVLDVNDNKPRFSETSYFTRVTEATQVGTRITQMTAEDPDTGVWSLITYSLAKKSTYFSIDPVHGTLVLVDTLNYSKRRAFQFDIIATDGGGLSSSVTIVIDVIESSSINGSKVLKCYSCSKTADCDQRQLSYSQTTSCLSSQVCFMSATEDSWGAFRYMRGCRGKSQCATNGESCTRRENGRHHCLQCCAKFACNGQQFRQHRLKQARGLLEAAKQVHNGGHMTALISSWITLASLSLHFA